MIIVFWVVASKVMQTATKVSAEPAVSVFRTEYDIVAEISVDLGSFGSAAARKALHYRNV